MPSLGKLLRNLGNGLEDLAKKGEAKLGGGVTLTVGPPRPPSLTERVDRVVGMPMGHPARDGRLSSLVTEALSGRDYGTALKAARNQSEFVRDTDLSRVSDAALSDGQLSVSQEAANLIRTPSTRNDRLVRVAERFEQQGNLMAAKDALKLVSGGSWDRPYSADQLAGRLVERFMAQGDRGSLQAAVELGQPQWSNGWQKDELMTRVARQATAHRGNWDLAQQAINQIGDSRMQRKAQRDFDFARMPPPPPPPVMPHHPPRKPGVSIDFGPVSIDIR